jgi:hypothetical protein
LREEKSGALLYFDEIFGILNEKKCWPFCYTGYLPGKSMQLVVIETPIISELDK